jgi:filamentous hemagglutinin
MPTRQHHDKRLSHEDWAWGALDVALAGKVGTSVGGNISTQQVTREGLVATLNANERAELAKLSTLSDTAKQGALAENVTNGYMARNGFTQLEGKCGSNNCFDGVFVKGDTVYVLETKPLQANGSIKLDNSTGFVQLDKDWIEYSASRLASTNDPAKQQTAALIQKALDPSSNLKLVKIVAGVNENGVTLVKLAK